MTTNVAAPDPDARPLSDPQVKLEPVADPADLEPLWRDLERRSAGSFFQSWGWIGCWLRNLPPAVTPQALQVFDGAEIVALGVLVPGRDRRHGVVRSNRLSLNETGDASVDPLTLEYNGVLADARVANQALHVGLEWLAKHRSDWDELRLGGLDEAQAQACATIGRQLGLHPCLQGRKPCRFVDLDDVRRGGRPYISLLSRNTRYQIRRARRLYERSGPIVIEAARDAAEAIGVLEQLRNLHQAYWTGRGEPGAFADAFFERFHRDLIESRFAAGEIQLLRVSAGAKVIGCLYNFVRNGTVHAYQSGFAYDDGPRSKPGLVSHHAAIDYNLAQGAQIYDFMAGEGQHKRSLGTGARKMTWLVLQRRHAVFWVEGTLRSLKRWLSDRGGRFDEPDRSRA